MSDSFFGFNTTLPGDDRNDDDDSEFEYDALNDETFGSAMNGDWEDLHENLVQLERKVEPDDDDDDDNLTAKSNSNSHRDGDYHSLERDLMRLGLRHMPGASNDDFESRITLDPSVWAPPPPPPSKNRPEGGSGHPTVNMFGVPQPQQFHAMPQVMTGPKMCTLEDIERNMRTQPVTGMQNNNGHHHHQPQPHMFPPQNPVMPGAPLNAPSRLPPGFGPTPHQQQQQQGGLPPGHIPPHGNNFGPHPPFPMNRPGPPQGFPMMGPPHPHGPPPMHGGPPHPQMPPQSPNHYNKRLVMEIQQTHPLLCYNRMNHPGMPPMHPMFMQPGGGGPGGPMSMPPPHPMQPHNNHPMGGHMMNGNKQQQQHQQRGYSPMMARDGNLSLARQLNGDEEREVRDEYRNLMTPRDKQWLIGIQLLQLNTDTPYIDDYYYTVHKERRMQGRRDNRIHKDNQLNHPLTQHQGHAQLVLQSMGNRNSNKAGFPNNRDSTGRDGRKMSESRGSNGNEKQGDQQQQTTPRTYTPLQFENSLGKLQCGSVTAPRKIIDMEIMAAETGGASLPPAMEVTAQRKCRQLLLHIETLYRVVLKLEDLSNPTAIEAAALVKEKKERERKAAQEQAEREAAVAAAAAQEGSGIVAATTSKLANASVGRLTIDSVLGEDKSKVGEETQEELLRVLVLGLSVEKVVVMMAVRKGRTLLQRAMAQLEDMEHAWQTWLGIFLAVPLALKKDREETELQLLAFTSVLKRHVKGADLKQLYVLGQGIDQKAAVLLSTKFGMGAIILMISRAEDLFASAKDTLNMEERRHWNGVLSNLCAGAVALREGKGPSPQPSNDQLVVLGRTIAHLLRFPDLTTAQTLLNTLADHMLEEVW